MEKGSRGTQAIALRFDYRKYLSVIISFSVCIGFYYYKISGESKQKHGVLAFAGNVASSMGSFAAHHLFSSKNLDSETAWYENLQVMQRAKLRTNDPNLANRIRFLAVNYLNKVAPPVLTPTRLIGWKLFESTAQVSPFAPYQYHRAFTRAKPEWSSSINQRFALGDKSPLLLTDTDQIDKLFPLKFTVLNRKNQHDWETLLEKSKKEILFDFTEELKDFLLTENDGEKEKACAEKIALLQQEVSTLSGIKDTCCTAIARIKFTTYGETMGGIKVLPLFGELSPQTLLKTHPTLIHAFMEETGVAIGAIQLRRLVPDAFPLPESPLASETSAPPLFANKNLFLKELKGIQLGSGKPHVEVLGRSFLSMVEGFFEKVTTEEWFRLYQEPAFQEIAEKALANILVQLKKQGNDARFIQSLELAYAELTILLELTTPYKTNDFATIYPKAFTICPEALRPYVKGGLGKTAETIFALANLASQEIDPNSHINIWNDGFYYEHAILLGANSSFDEVMSNPTIKKVNFYGCAFNPSIHAKIKSHYSQRDLIADIERILEEKEDTSRLTVAIDFTNDLFNSPKTEELLTHFEPLIHEGRLNIVLFGSGQKFDMLGMDSFYGSPFLLINNGADHWKPFNTLLTEEVNQTDRLSNQWFCLLYEYAPKASDSFRKLFFDNTRDIIQHIPSALTYRDGRNLMVIPIHNPAQPTFIDIKIAGAFHFYKSCLLLAYFQSHGVEENVKITTRGSFGFLHPNATLILDDEATTLRLHPGILLQENRAILNFLEDLS